jgi:ribose transport system permease protein
MAVLSPVFLTTRNVGNVLGQSAVIAVLALAQLLVIITRGIDLSVGSVLALSAVVGALVYASIPSGTLVVVAMLLTGTAVGAINGVVFVYGRLPHPFIITLATLSIARGLALWLSGGQPLQGMPNVVQQLGSGSIGWLPISAFLVAGLAALGLLLTTRMVWGRWIYAVGGNPDGARRSAIPVNRVVVSVYVLSGLAAGVAAVITSGRLNGGSPTFGELAELDTIAAVVIGGASFLGGRGTVGKCLDRSADDRCYSQRHEPAQRRRVPAADRDWRRHRVGRRARCRPGTARAAIARDAGGPRMSTPALSITGATKRFGAVVALDSVDLSVNHGEVLALLGDNGAGKSTLIKCISGVHRFDSGTVQMDGRDVEISSPAVARSLGIETVYQDLALFDNLDPAANFYAGREVAGPRWLPRGLRLMRKGEMATDTAAVLSRLQVGVADPRATVGLMSGGQRQAIAVARAAAFASQVVILDEPTAALGVRESRSVLDLIKRLRDEGRAVIVISHAMDHVIEIADRAVVMRRGRKVGEEVPHADNRQRIVSLIIGGDG